MTANKYRDFVGSKLIYTLFQNRASITFNNGHTYTDTKVVYGGGVPTNRHTGTVTVLQEFSLLRNAKIEIGKPREELIFANIMHLTTNIRQYMLTF